MGIFSGKKQTVGYKYYMGLHMAISRTAWDVLRRIKIGKRIAWEGSVTASDQITIDAPKLFGGDDKQGGVQGDLDVMMGEATQPVNDYLSSKIAAVMPAFRRFFSVVFRGGLVSSNSQFIQPWACQGTRIKQGWGSGSCWYPEKAEVPRQTYGLIVTPISAENATSKYKVQYGQWVGDYSAADYDDSAWASGSGGFGDALHPSATTYGFTAPNTIIERAGPTNPYITLWVRHHFTTTDPLTSVLVKLLHDNDSRAWLDGAAIPGSPVSEFYAEASISMGAGDHVLVFQILDYYDGGGDGRRIACNFTLDKQSYGLSTPTRFDLSSFPDFFGLSWTLPCLVDEGYFCQCAAGTSQSATFDAPEGETYDVKLRVRGVVELNPYSGGTQLSPSYFYKNKTGSQYLINIYYIEVSSPYARYYINKGSFSSANLTALDYEVTIPIDGGATVTLVSDSYDSGQVRNNTSVSTTDDDPDAPIIVTQPYAGQFAQIDLMSINDQTAFYDLPDMNPAHIVYQMLTDPDLEMGYPTADVDEDSFTAAADTFFDEPLGLTLSWNRTTKIEDFIKVVLDHAGAALYADPFTGKFVLKAIRDDYDHDALTVYDESSIVAIEEFQRAGYGETVNQITVRYRDQDNDTDATTAPVQDAANIQAQGKVIAETRDYPGFSYAAIAQRIAARDLKAASTRLARAKIRMTRAIWDGAPAGVIKVSWAKLGLVEVIFRIVAINYGSLDDGEIVIDVVEDVFGLPAATYAAQQPPTDTPPTITPATIIIQDAYEATYWELAQSQSSASLASLSADAAYVCAVANKRNSQQDAFEMWDRVSPTDYAQQDTSAYTPNARLDTAIQRDATSLVYYDGTDVDDVVVPCLMLVGTGRLAEWMVATAINTSTSTITVTRAVLDTTPQIHYSGTRLWFVDDSRASDVTEYATGDSVDIKLLSATGTGATDIDDATALNVVPDQRLYRPYPPGNIVINGESYPSSISAALSVAYEDRNRLTQTSGYTAQTATGITSEAGVTYNGYLYDDNTGDLILSETGIANPWEPTLTDAYTVRMEIESERDGVTSWQRQVRVFDTVGLGRATAINQTRVTASGALRITTE